MNAPDTKTPAQDLHGTNVPEFHATLDKAIAQLAEAPDVALTIWRDKQDKRAFVTFPAGFRPPSDVEKIITLRVVGGGKRFLNADEELRRALRDAAIGALGYYWRKCAAVLKDGRPGWSSDRRGLTAVAWATPHPAGFSR
jgi:hypothetical protein